MMPMPPPGQMPGMLRPPQGPHPMPGIPGQVPPPGGNAPQLTASALSAAPPSTQKQMIGEKLYAAIGRYQPELAGKITGMMLEMDNNELLMIMESEQRLKAKVDEALRVLAPRQQA